jgi:uncharacterized membrane protein YkoI
MTNETEHELFELKEKIEASKEYKEWADKNPDFYLVHMFLMSNHQPQLGYYNKKIDKIITFDMHNKDNIVILNPASEVFKESVIVELLKLDEIKTTLADAMASTKQLAIEKYPGQIIDKSIAVLQMIKGRAVYNITLITRSFKMINVKIYAKDGGLIESHMQSILDLGIKE